MGQTSPTVFKVLQLLYMMTQKDSAYIRLFNSQPPYCLVQFTAPILLGSILYLEQDQYVVYYHI